MHYPAWTSDPGISEENRKSARLLFLINLCAAHHNSSASLQQMCDAMGITTQTLRASVGRGSVTPTVAISMEHLLGREVITKEELCPEKFKA